MVEAYLLSKSEMILEVEGKRSPSPQPSHHTFGEQSTLSLTSANLHSSSKVTADNTVSGGKKWAYVIFHGRRTGVFRTWSVRTSFKLC